MTDRLTAINVTDTSKLPAGYYTRTEILEKLKLAVTQNKFSYAARRGSLGAYYAVGNVGYYSLERAAAQWGTPAVIATARRESKSPAPDKTATASTAPAPVQTPHKAQLELRSKPGEGGTALAD